MSSTGSIPEFVKKLFNMLEENTYPHVFSWGKEGDTFVVKDPNEFARHILPRHFKHSNFASFVRQLNKYDFHKLRLPEDGQRIYGDQAWEFRHPNFKYNRQDLLEEIKRKPTGKSLQSISNSIAPETSAASATYSAPGVKPPKAEENLKVLAASLQKEINSLKETQKDMTDKIKSFDHKYNSILRNVEGFKKNMEEQDALMKDIMSFMSKQKPTMMDQGLTNIIHQYNNIMNASEIQLNRINSAINNSPNTGMSTTSSPPATLVSSSSNGGGISMIDASSVPLMPSTDDVALSNVLSSTSLTPTDLMVASGPPQSVASLIPVKNPSRKRRRIQPGWSVPPRVLLVDDDSIFRRLSTKLLQMAGCTIDVAVDGEEAVRKLGTMKYDLVLMDIMMPKLDGMSATRNIRQYDTLTPIISMTSNTTDQDIQQYILSGMTDVLPKPFNQGTLGSLLERYCAHLVIQRHNQQQFHLLQQNFNLNNSLIDLNMTPQLTLLEEDNEDVKGKGKETFDNNNNNVQFLTTFNNNNNQLVYTPTSIIPPTQPLPYMPAQSLQAVSKPWFVYQRQGDNI